MTNYNSIEQFKSGFKGGTRTNRFNVKATWPAGIGASDSITMSDKTTFKISATSMPASDLNVISVPYRGRRIFFAGDRKYPLWNITILDDSEDNNLWKIFHTWMEKIDGHQSHLYSGAPDYDYSDHFGTFTLNQYGLNGSNNDVSGTGIRTVTLKNVWPSSVEPIDLDMSKSDLNVFTVRLHYDYVTYSGDTIAQNL